MTDAGGSKRKQQEQETDVLQRLSVEIDDIVNKHGQVPADDRVLNILKEKVLCRNKMQQQILFPKSKNRKTTDARVQQSLGVQQSLVTIPYSRDKTPPLPTFQETTASPTVCAESENAASPPKLMHRNHYLWTSENGVRRDQVTSLRLPVRHFHASPVSSSFL